jgi:hypothetical protein
LFNMESLRRIDLMPSNESINQISEEMKELAEKQIQKERKVVDYDTREPLVGSLVEKFIRPYNPEDLNDKSRDIYLPAYQRKFVWNIERQSKFIESVLLGLPLPFMFLADMQDGRLEVVDGSQRIQTLDSFLDNKLILEKLKRLNHLNGFTFDDLPLSQQRRFKNQPIRVIVLGEKAVESVKKEIFERINTGSDILKDMEVRKGAYQGPFYDFVEECASNPRLIAMCPLSPSRVNRQEREELVLRFFAYSERYLLFKHEVKSFLDSYMRDKDINFSREEYRRDFLKMVDFVEKYFPYGFRKVPGAKSTPRVRFEAISVGVNLALRVNPTLVPKSMDWLDSKEFIYHTTTHASNSSTRLKDRVEFVRDSLLNTK